MQFSFAHSRKKRGPVVLVDSEKKQRVSGGVSYVQLWPKGWAWYRLISIEGGDSELDLVQSSDPGYVFKTMRFSARDADSEKQFNSLGLMFVDAPPNVADQTRRNLVQALSDLVESNRRFEQERQERHRIFGGWWRLFGRGSVSSQQQADDALVESDKHCQEARIQFLELCRQANEEVQLVNEYTS